MLRRIDDNGLFIEDVLLNEIPYLTEYYPETITNEDGSTEEVYYEQVVMRDILDGEGIVIGQEPVFDPHYIDVPCPEGFYTPKWDWNAEQWIEGMPQEEIDALKNITPELTTDERLDELATNVNDALLAIMMLSIE